MESSHLQETLPVFHLSPRKLQEMTASQCAFDCWRNVIMMKNYDSEKIRMSIEWLWRPSLFSCDDIAPFPAGVRSQINHKIRLIGKELQKWCDYHSFLKLSPGVMVNCFVLNPAGDICYKRTAKNLLTVNPALMVEEQFEIACKYCFEEDVERLWFLSKNNNHNIDDPSKGFGVVSLNLDYGGAGAMDYWCSKMRGELQEFYKKANEEQERSPEWCVLLNGRWSNITNWAQGEYFWHKLNREEQCSIVRDISFNQLFMKYLIPKLDDVMLGNIPRPHLKSVFEKLAFNELCYESALQLWRYVKVKNIIVEEISFFYETLVSLSKNSFVNPDSYSCHISSLLNKMWLSASVDFKDYVLCNLEDLFARCLECINISRSFGSDVGFIIELLCDASFEIRQQIWLRCWRKFVLLAQVTDILRIMTLCFNNADDIVQFKRKYMLDFDELRDIFTQFIKGGFFYEMIEYLKFCCSDDEDEKLVREAKRKVALQNFDRISRCVSERVALGFRYAN